MSRMNESIQQVDRTIN